jgi:hypothetical protein
MKTHSSTTSQSKAMGQTQTRRDPSSRRNSSRPFPATMSFTISKQMRRPNRMENVNPRSSTLHQRVIRRPSKAHSNLATSRQICRSSLTFQLIRHSGLGKEIPESLSRQNRVEALLSHMRLIQATGTRRILATTKINRMASHITVDSMNANRDHHHQSTSQLLPMDKAAETTTLTIKASMQAIPRATLAEMLSQVCQLQSTLSSRVTSVRNDRAQ